MDHKMIASKQGNGREVKYISKTYNIPIEVVEKAIAACGINGKLGRSREIVYGAENTQRR